MLRKNILSFQSHSGLAEATKLLGEVEETCGSKNKHTGLILFMETATKLIS